MQRTCHCGATLGRELEGGFIYPARSNARTCGNNCRQFRHRIRGKVDAGESLWPTQQQSRTERLGEKWVLETANVLADLFHDELTGRGPKTVREGWAVYSKQRRNTLLSVLSRSWKGAEIAAGINAALQLEDDNGSQLTLDLDAAAPEPELLTAAA